ncbi:MAG: adenine-specific DNA methylase [Candidatus Paralactobacillus gallistercoris]|uniref:Adenine-specific DNA methylase n=1 Tax=Candidatus Paralactobacillus gallistercoris TaxID=2838724 RepID=A0A948X171_9LACO|nr:adenine-specific DNA methylase [Candidatus Paralactobacillus gallistercoris]
MSDGSYNFTTNSKYILNKEVIVNNGTNENELVLTFKSRWTQKTVLSEIKKGTNFLVKSTDFAIRAQYSEDKISNESPKQIIFTNNNNPLVVKDRFNNKVGTNENATLETINLMKKNVFSYPKPTSLIRYLISLVIKNNNYSHNSTILDFFAGSATTADAVMQLNAEDGGHRKFIMVQLPEKTYELDKNGNQQPTKSGKAAFDAGYMSIDEISRERIRRAAQKIKETHPNLKADFDGGFKHYRVVKPNKLVLSQIADFNPDEELITNVDAFSSQNLKVAGNATGEETILTTWLTDDGYDLDIGKLNKYDFAGYKAYGVANSRLYLINDGWSIPQTKELLNQLGTNKLHFQSIVLYGYSFKTLDLKELENGIKQLNRDNQPNLIKRY